MCAYVSYHTYVTHTIFPTVNVPVRQGATLYRESPVSCNPDNGILAPPPLFPCAMRTHTKPVFNQTMGLPWLGGTAWIDKQQELSDAIATSRCRELSTITRLLSTLNYTLPRVSPNCSRPHYGGLDGITAVGKTMHHVCYGAP